MPGTYTLPYFDIFAALLVFARMSSMLATMPIFGYRGVPLQVKAALSILLTIIVFPLVSIGFEPPAPDPLAMLLLVAEEVLVGLLIGFAASLLFYGVQMAGQIVGIQIGFGIINVIDPNTESQISIIATLNYIVALLIFLALNGHLFLIQALVLSYERIPLGGAHFPAELVQQMVQLTGAIFEIALKVAAPLMITLFITDVALGFMARVAPQMNVFLVGFPLKIGVGLLVLTLVISLFPFMFGKLYDAFQRDMVTLIRLVGM